MKTFLLWASAISGLVAAALWFWATVLKVPYRQIMGPDGMYESAITENEDGVEVDIFRTAKAQTTWNRWAALFTGISMLAQAVSLMC